MKITVSFVVRVILWVLLIVAPGGVFLLPLLVGDALVRRRRLRDQEAAAGARPSLASDSGVAQHPLATPVSGS